MITDATREKFCDLMDTVSASEDPLARLVIISLLAATATNAPEGSEYRLLQKLGEFHQGEILRHTGEKS